MQAMQWLLQTLALPQVGLTTLFVVAFVSATLLPLGSEPAVVGLLKVNPELFWPAILVATAGNVLGGVVTWWVGYGAERVYEKAAHHEPTRSPDRPKDEAPQLLGQERSDVGTHHARALKWLERFGPKACLLSWLPIVGDPLCAVAGWLRMPFWPCVAYMLVGKFARYLTMTTAFLWVWPGPI